MEAVEQGRVAVEGGQVAYRVYGSGSRPLLCLQVCDALGGDLDLALLPALALECIHAFSLVHDDIADGDRQRRGRPSLWARAGTGPALNAGDALMALGLANLATVLLQ